MRNSETKYNIIVKQFGSNESLRICEERYCEAVKGSFNDETVSETELEDAYELVLLARTIHNFVPEDQAPLILLSDYQLVDITR